MLKIESITKVFNPDTASAKKALDNLSLHVKPGDFITIIGANGAGKSTLFGSICADFYTDSGRIMIDNEDTTFTPSHIISKSVGRLFQDPMRGTAPGMSIEENLALAAGKKGWLATVGKKEREMFREKLKVLDMGLEDRMSHPVGLLSGGQRQALSLLMATVNVPKLLLLDEHTAALDPGAAEKVLNLTKDIIEKDNITALMITHNMKSALELGNRTLMMDRGKIIRDISEKEKKGLGVGDFIAMFNDASGKELDNDRMLLGVEDLK